MESDSSLGIKKIVDCKIENGQQYYKVKWEPTWEPVASLSTCQHLIDEFWLFVNNAKAKEDFVHQQRRKQVLEHHLNGNGAAHVEALDEDSKADVHRLIARTSSTTPGSGVVRSPSELLKMPAHHRQQQQQQQQQQPQHVHSPEGSRNYDLLGLTKIEAPENVKPAPPSSAKPSTTATSGASSAPTGISNSASLKYVENFSNPYVKLIIVCKICSREASRFQNNWKRHYLTHMPNEDRPTPKKKRSNNNNNKTAAVGEDYQRMSNGEYVCTTEYPYSDAKSEYPYNDGYHDTY